MSDFARIGLWIPVAPPLIGIYCSLMPGDVIAPAPYGLSPVPRADVAGWRLVLRDDDLCGRNMGRAFMAKAVGRWKYAAKFAAKP
jgi:hypothetical protein